MVNIANIGKCQKCGQLQAQLNEQTGLGNPHDVDPENCPTFYDSCHCTVDTLVHNIERAEKAEAQLKSPWRLVSEGSPEDEMNSRDIILKVAKKSMIWRDFYNTRANIQYMKKSGWTHWMPIPKLPEKEAMI